MLFVAVAAIVSLVAAGYPATPRDAVVNLYFGTRVPDPYRWLERVHASRTRRWINAQTALTEGEFARMPERSAMRSLVARLMGTRSDGLPQFGGTVRAFARSHGSGRLPYVVVRCGRFERVVLDQNRRWPTGTTTLADWQLAPDGRSLAYATKHGGVGLVRWHVVDIATGRDRSDLVVGTPDWAPIAWGANGRGFYYGGYQTDKLAAAGAPIGTGYSVRFHRLGTRQAADEVVFARPDRPNWLPYAQQSTDGRYEIVGAIDGDSVGTLVAVRDLHATHGPLRELRTLRHAHYDYVGRSGTALYFFTNADAARGRLVAIDLRAPRVDRTVIRSGAETLEDVTAIGRRFVARYLRDGRSHLVAYRRNGTRIGGIALPGPGSVPEIRSDTKRTTAYFQFSSPTSPPATYLYDARSGQTRVLAREPAPFDPAKFVTEERFARSADGTRIPVFVAHRRDARADGSVPTLLTGYGGFGYAYDPRWTPLGAAWLARGGTFAIACVRGGGEYGESWHRAGMRQNKHHAFEDLAAAAHLLIRHGFTARKTLGLYGYSGGGLLAGATEIEQPALFGAVVEAAGPVDVLRGPTYGSESAWTGELGSATANASQFRWLYAYAPLVAMRRGTHYPATLVMTSDDDERVSPAHAFKFAATLQWAQGNDEPVLLYVARGTGHIGGGTLSQAAAPLADAETFLFAHLRDREHH